VTGETVPPRPGAPEMTPEEEVGPAAAALAASRGDFAEEARPAQRGINLRDEVEEAVR
jgi:hypothetical protein